jgi:hypothetical protein
VGIIREADAHRLLDDRGFTAHVEVWRPLVVDYLGPMAAHLRQAYPEMTRVLTAQYEPADHAGAYEVLEWKD